jgi:lysine 2,3-aminomutase
MTPTDASSENKSTDKTLPNQEFRNSLTDFGQLQTLNLIDLETSQSIEEITNTFDVRIPSEWLGKITGNGCGKSWSADAAPLALQVVPQAAELKVKENELIDPIGDERFSPIEGLTHRYADRVLLKPTHLCAMYCRFCFRRYKVSEAQHNLSTQKLDAALRYIESHEEIREVILTGGDPMILSDRKLAVISERLAKITHVRLLRIHSRILSANPRRITPELIQIFKNSGKSVWFVSHINSHQELTGDARAAASILIDNGIPVLNQAVLLKGVNDQLDSLLTLLQQLIELRIQPYYLHYPDLAKGTSHFRIPLSRALELMKGLRGRLPGYAIPDLVVDIPGGEGKVVLNPEWARRLPSADSPTSSGVGFSETWEFTSPLTGQMTRVDFKFED